MPNESVVHVVDDDDAVRESLSFLLRSAKIEVQAYESAVAFLEALPRLKRGCVITDVRIPGISGLELLKHLKDVENGMPVIVITGHGDVALAVEAMKNGAMDFLEKPFDDDVLMAAIRSALDRHGKHGKREGEKVEILNRLATLSNRERQMLEGLVAGFPNKTIAFDLGISPRTIEVYRANVMTKMMVASLSELVRMALVAGILDEAESQFAQEGRNPLFLIHIKEITPPSCCLVHGWRSCDRSGTKHWQ